MTLVICDSSFLILISKLESLPLLIEVFKEIVIPYAVFIESVETGKKLKKWDALIIEKMINERKIVVKNINDKSEKQKMIRDFNIHEGEAEAIILYLECKAQLLGTDDYQTIKVCKIFDIHYFTTPIFILRSYENQLLSKDITLGKFDKLLKIGWYKQELILQFKNKIIG